MIGSMYSAVSGLSAHQTKMNVIGNNIANVNTYGFKSSRVVFSDVFYQTLNGASASTKDGGGINPSQQGYGAKVGSIDILNTRSGSADTGRALDVYINGDGYLPMMSSDGTVKYSRVGNLKFDDAGYLVDYNGNFVLGLPLNETTGLPEMDSNGTLSVQKLQPIRLDPEVTYTGIAIGASGEITAIKEGDPVFQPGPGTSWIKESTVNVDSIYSGEVNVTTSRSNTVAFYTTTNDAAAAANIKGAVTVPNTADIDGAVTMNWDANINSGSGGYVLKFKDRAGLSHEIQGTENGGTPGLWEFGVDAIGGGGSVNVAVQVSSTAGDPMNIGQGSMNLGTVGSDSVTITAIAYDEVGNETKQTATWTAGGSNQVGLLPGVNMTIDPARLSTLKDITDQKNIGKIGPGAGVPLKLAQLSTTTFRNPDGLSQSGDGYYLETSSSGEAVATKPGAQGTGTLRSSALEMSNVDLSKEFTEMITTQRGFQANTRMITVSDEMLAELVAMKR